MAAIGVGAAPRAGRGGSSVVGSFQRVTETDAPRRLIMAVSGHERTGKTHWALTAPAPLGYMQLDAGGEDLVPKMRRLRPKAELWHARYAVDIMPGLSDSEVERRAKPVWERFAADYEKNLPNLRTLVIDTGSEAWELLRLAEFGKVASVKPIHYGPVNATFRRLVRISYNHSCNVIWIHKMKKAYKNDSWNGGYEPACFSAMGYEVQIQARVFRDEDGFQMEVEDCRQNPDLAGQIIPEPLCNFPDVAQLVYPDSRRSDWE